MTYRDRLKLDKPKLVAAGKRRGVVLGCPGDHFRGATKRHDAECFGDCEACWNAETEGEE